MTTASNHYEIVMKVLLIMKKKGRGFESLYVALSETNFIDYNL
jgi:hypothetical protein